MEEGQIFLKNFADWNLYERFAVLLYGSTDTQARMHTCVSGCL